MPITKLFENENKNCLIKHIKKLLRIKMKNKISKSAYLILIPRGDYFKCESI